MLVDSGSIAQPNLGKATYVMNTTGFKPAVIIFFLGGNYYGDLASHISIGFGHKPANGSAGMINQNVQSFADLKGDESGESDTEAISLYARVNGTLQEVVSFTLMPIVRNDLFSLNHIKSSIDYNICWLALG